MISIHKLVKKVSHNLTMVDRTIIKLDLIIIGLLLAKLFPELTSHHRGWYVGAIVLAEIYFIHKISKIVKE